MKPKAKPEQEKIKREKNNRKIYLHIEGEIKKVQEGLKLMYWGDKANSEDFIHRLFMKLEGVKDCVFGTIFDEHPFDEWQKYYGEKKNKAA